MKKSCYQRFVTTFFCPGLVAPSCLQHINFFSNKNDWTVLFNGSHNWHISNLTFSSLSYTPCEIEGIAVSTFKLQFHYFFLFRKTVLFLATLLWLTQMLIYYEIYSADASFPIQIQKTAVSVSSPGKTNEKLIESIKENEQSYKMLRKEKSFFLQEFSFLKPSHCSVFSNQQITMISLPLHPLFIMQLIPFSKLANGYKFC